MAATAGTRLGPYELVRPLGAGGSGEVWEAVLHGPGGFRKAVALKRLRAQRSDPEADRALLHEARLGGLVQHPNVVGTLGVSWHEGEWVVALELVRGASAAELLRALGPLPPRAVLELGAQAAAGLAHVHELAVDGVPAGLVHRDVKPGNLLVDRTGFVKLADLGIAALVGEGDGGAAGTLGYAAPEQLVGRAVPASDVFALGVTLAVLATGTRPFGSGTQAMRAVRAVEAALADPAFLAPVEAAVTGLGEVVRRCLRADPAERPPARALQEALAALRFRQVEGPALPALLARVRPELGDLAPTTASDTATRIALAGNLRPPRDAFVGRGDDLAAVRDLVLSGDERLLVLHGAGGAGKTRLSLEVARLVLPALPGGAWAIDLSDATDVDSVCAATARALRLEADRRDPAGWLGRVLAAKGRALVVLDNLEQCLPALPDTLGRWLALAPEVVFLGTSRAPTGLTGERLLPVDGLPASEARALFAARVGRALRPEEVGPAEEVCAALAGWPLAVELAAARVRVLGVAGVRDHLSLGLLSGGGRELPDRHRSLAASLDWSVALLSPGAAAAFAALSVFEGPFPLEAAAAVLGAADPVAALLPVQELVDASLLRVDPGAGRFSLLGVVRAHAALRLAGAARAAAEKRHGDWFGQLGDPAVLEALDLPGSEGRARELAAARDDALAACRRAVARGDGPTALATLGAAFGDLDLRGGGASFVDLAVEVAERAPLDDRARGRAWIFAGRAALRFSRLEEAQRHLARGLALAHAAGDPIGEGLAREFEGNVVLAAGRPREALAPLEAARALYRAAGARRREAVAALGLARARYEADEVAASRVLYEETLDVARAIGARQVESAALVGLGRLLVRVGEVEGARDGLVRALALNRALGHLRHESVALNNLGNLELACHRPREALAWLQAARRIERALGDPAAEASSLQLEAMAHEQLGDTAAAAESFARSLAAHREIGNARGELVTLANHVLWCGLHGRFSEGRRAAERALALAASTGSRRFEAATRLHLGHLALLEGHPDEARDLAVDARERYRALGIPHDDGEVELLLAQAEAERGRSGVAEAHLAAALASRDGDVAVRAAALGLRAVWAAEAGDGAAARVALALAETAATRLADPAEQARLILVRAVVDGLLGDRAAAARWLAAATAGSDRADLARLRRRVEGILRGDPG